MSPTTSSPSYKPPSNYANLQSVQTTYSTSGPTPQSDHTIYARPVKVVREPLDSYNPPRDPGTPAGYVRQNLTEHRVLNNRESPDFNYSRSPSASSGGFVPRYEVSLIRERSWIICCHCLHVFAIFHIKLCMCFKVKWIINVYHISAYDLALFKSTSYQNFTVCISFSFHPWASFCMSYPMFLAFLFNNKDCQKLWSIQDLIVIFCMYTILI